jgi:Protein of unknown function (DUF3551)
MSGSQSISGQSVRPDFLMRIPTLAIFAIGALSAAAPLRAQTFDPGYPVCLHVYGPATYYECQYTSLAQCNATAAGRAAQCLVNPYAAAAPFYRPPVGHWRHHRRE